MDNVKLWLETIEKEFGSQIVELTRGQIDTIVKNSKGLLEWPRWLTDNMLHRKVRNVYYVPWHLLQETEQNMSITNEAGTTTAADKGIPKIPDKLSYYTPFGFHDDLQKIVASRLWCPVFVTGLSGCGKTTIIEQVAVAEKRELYRVNITTETDEDDLLGGMRLVNGDTVFRFGPVVEALQRGALLLLDEIDYGSSKLACLQPVLEGRGVFIKKISTWIPAQPGFNVLATANTKGRGDESGRFAGTNVMNGAFLDRFDFTFEHEFPNKEVEAAILDSFLANALKYKMDDNMSNYVDVLVNWADSVRAAYAKDSCSETISTRRLLQALKGYVIFRDRKKAIKLCLSNYDEETKSALMAMYEKMDVSTLSPEKQAALKLAQAQAAARKAADATPFGKRTSV